MLDRHGGKTASWPGPSRYESHKILGIAKMDDLVQQELNQRHETA